MPDISVEDYLNGDKKSNNGDESTSPITMNVSAADAKDAKKPRKKKRLRKARKKFEKTVEVEEHDTEEEKEKEEVKLAAERQVRVFYGMLFN